MYGGDSSWFDGMVVGGEEEEREFGGSWIRREGKGPAIYGSMGDQLCVSHPPTERVGSLQSRSSRDFRPRDCPTIHSRDKRERESARLQGIDL